MQGKKKHPENCCLFLENYHECHEYCKINSLGWKYKCFILHTC